MVEPNIRVSMVVDENSRAWISKPWKMEIDVRVSRGPMRYYDDVVYALAETVRHVEIGMRALGDVDVGVVSGISHVDPDKAVMRGWGRYYVVDGMHAWATEHIVSRALSERRNAGVQSPS